MRDSNTERSLHRIREREREILEKLIDDHTMPIEADSDETKAEKQRIAMAYQQYKDEMMDKPYAKAKIYRRLCYEDIGPVLNILGLTWKQYMDLASIDTEDNPYPVKWKSEELKTLCETLDHFTESDREKILNTAKQLAGPSVSKLYTSDMPTPWRILEALRVEHENPRFLAKTFRQLNLQSKVTPRLFANDYQETAVNFATIPYIANELNLSAHWLLRMPENTPLLAEHAMSEVIMDIYCLLPNERKNILQFVACTMKETI